MRRLFIIVFLAIAMIGVACQRHTTLTFVDYSYQSPKRHIASVEQETVLAVPEPSAVMVARQIFAQGGSMVDAAIAVSFALAVARPQSTGIGGGGFMLIYDPNVGKTIAYDFRERAPHKAFERMYLNAKGEVLEGRSVDGVMAAGVPGLVDGLYSIHKRHKSNLAFSQLVAPAIKLARDGVLVSKHLAAASQAKRKILLKYAETAKIFLRADGSPLRAGDLLIQKDLAKTLTAIANHGREGFYNGKVAKAI